MIALFLAPTLLYFKCGPRNRFINTVGNVLMLIVSIKSLSSVLWILPFPLSNYSTAFTRIETSPWAEICWQSYSYSCHFVCVFQSNANVVAAPSFYANSLNYTSSESTKTSWKPFCLSLSHIALPVSDVAPVTTAKVFAPYLLCKSTGYRCITYWTTSG